MNKEIKKLKSDLVKKTNQLKKKFNLDCSTEYKLKPNGRLIAFNRYEKLLMCNYQIIGTYNTKTCIWRWAWGNKYINCSLSKLSKKSIEFGEKYKNKKYLSSKVLNIKNSLNFLVSVTSNETVDGYIIYKKPNSNIKIYLVLKNCKKYKEIKKKSKKKSC